MKRFDKGMLLRGIFTGTAVLAAAAYYLFWLRKTNFSLFFVFCGIAWFITRIRWMAIYSEKHPNATKLEHWPRFLNDEPKLNVLNLNKHKWMLLMILFFVLENIYSRKR